MTADSQKFQTSTLILCEGVEERSLVQAMIRMTLIPDADVRYIGEFLRTGNGIDGLQRMLTGSIGVAGFAKIDKVCIIFDNDEDPSQALRRVREHIVAANSNPAVKRKFSLPEGAWTQTKDAAISMFAAALPSAGRAGCLDTLVADFLRRERKDVLACAEAMLTCAKIADWSQQKKDKALVRAAIAILNRSNPAATLSKVWEQQPDLIPPQCEEFRQLVATLGSL